MLDLLLTLPYVSVLEWIKGDDLKVHSENYVVYLLNIWLRRHEPSAIFIDALIKEIRVINLGPAYFHQILPNIKWFKDSMLSKKIHITCILRERGIARHKHTDLQGTVQDLPSSWLFAPWKAHGYIPPTSTDFTLVLMKDELKDLYDYEKAVSEPVYHNGHWIRSYVEKKRVQEPRGVTDYQNKQSWTLKVAFLLGSSYVAPCVAHLSLTAAIDKVGDATEKRRSATLILKNGTGLGWPDFLNRKCPTIQEVIAPYLRE